MTRLDLLAHMRRLHACGDAIRWVESQDGSPYALWRRCDRGDWLLWLVARAGVDRRLVVLAACDCAETALVHVPAGEEQPRIAIEAARRWVRGEVSTEEMRAAVYDVRAAYDACSVHDAASAYATTAAYDAAAAYAASEAATAAADAEYTYAAAADTAAHARSLAKSAKLVRRRIPWSAVRDALGVATREKGEV